MNALSLKPANIISLILKEEENFPNNPDLPLLLYRQALTLEASEPQPLESLFLQNHWGNSWSNGIYNYHH